jgi:hypothetical protein
VIDSSESEKIPCRSQQTRSAIDDSNLRKVVLQVMRLLKRSGEKITARIIY